MDFSEAIANSSSGRNARNRYIKEGCDPQELPTANELDNADTNEKKAYKRMASTILRLADSSWWASAPKMQGSHKVLGVLQGLTDHGYLVEILSSPFCEPSIEGKLKWCKENLPEEISVYHIRSDKESFANPEAVLIDDRKKVCQRFTDAGGHALLFNENWFLNLRTILNQNEIETIYLDLDGVLVDTKKHIIQTLESL
jgi:hypothetical protein